MSELTPTELSEREREVLRLVATGASNKEIAQRLEISPNTVKVHLRNIFAKIGVASRTEATLYAIQHGLAPSPAPGTPAPAAVEESDEPIAPVVEPIPAARPWLGWLALLAALILLAGGGLAGWRLSQPDSTPTPAISTLAPAASRWQSLAPLPTPRTGLAAATYGGRIFAIGGESGGQVTGAVEAYDPAAETWSGLADKPLPVAEASAVIVGGKLFVPGGRLASGQPTEVVEVYDPETGVWSQRASLPRALSAYALTAFEGRLYLFGGWDGQAVTGDAYRYDPEQDRWSELSPLPTARARAGAVAAGGKIYVIGGENAAGPLRVNEAYQPEKEASGEPAWQAAAPMPEARLGAAIASLADIVHVVGGSLDPAAPILKFSPLRQAWDAFPDPAPAQPAGAVVSVFEAYLHLLGGPQGEHAAFQAIFTINLPVGPQGP